MCPQIPAAPCIMITQMITNSWFLYLRRPGCSILGPSKKFPRDVLLNSIFQHLSSPNYIVSITLTLKLIRHHTLWKYRKDIFWEDEKAGLVVKMVVLIDSNRDYWKGAGQKGAFSIVLLFLTNSIKWFPWFK